MAGTQERHWTQPLTSLLSDTVSKRPGIACPQLGIAGTALHCRIAVFSFCGTLACSIGSDHSALLAGCHARVSELAWQHLSMPPNLNECLQVKAVGPYISCEVSTHVQGPLMALDRCASVATVDHRVPGLHLPATSVAQLKYALPQGQQAPQCPCRRTACSTCWSPAWLKVVAWTLSARTPDLTGWAWLCRTMGPSDGALPCRMSLCKPFPITPPFASAEWVCSTCWPPGAAAGTTMGQTSCMGRWASAAACSLTGTTLLPCSQSMRGWTSGSTLQRCAARGGGTPPFVAGCQVGWRWTCRCHADGCFDDRWLLFHGYFGEGCSVQVPPRELSTRGGRQPDDRVALLLLLTRFNLQGARQALLWVYPAWVTAAQASSCSFSGSHLWVRICCLGSCRGFWAPSRRLQCCWCRRPWSTAVTCVRGICLDAPWLRVDGCQPAGCRSLGAALGQVRRGGLSSGPPSSIHAQVGLCCRTCARIDLIEPYGLYTAILCSCLPLQLSAASEQHAMSSAACVACFGCSPWHALPFTPLLCSLQDR